MCRWIAYRGETIPLEQYVTAPAHSLVVQSQRALESTAAHQRRRLRHGLVRRACRARPLSRGAAGLVRRESALPLPPHPLAPLFRACARLDRHADHAAELPSLRLRALAVHAQRPDRQLVAAAPQGRGADPRRGLRLAHRHHRFGGGVPRHSRRRRRQGSARGDRARARDASPTWSAARRYKEPLRFTAALANGRDLYAFRYSANDNANSLYYRESGGNVVVVSEPLDAERAHWKPVPPGHAIVARDGEPVALEPFLAAQRVAAE